MLMAMLLLLLLPSLFPLCPLLLLLCLSFFFSPIDLFQLNLSPYPVLLILAASDGTQQGQSFNSTSRRPCGSGFVADAV
jgi:hypothetical protein